MAVCILRDGRGERDNMKNEDKIFEIISDWNKKNLKCCKCGETRSVKYKNVKESGNNIYYCNSCVLKIQATQVYR